MFAAVQYLSTAVVSLFFVAGVHAQVASNCTRTYTVQAGDVCDLISAAQGVSTFQLATVNAGVINSDCTNLFVDEVICLATDSQDCSPVHTVATGDTCFDIAVAAGITIPDVVAQNPNVTPDCNIYPGEVLCVKAASAAR
ncbi:hypothetical protein BDQ12DRAFT_690789 [Crucibulum laeve]|uniref:LysM domain-containing protein n=1 Tax=Crucibulum laeve TaxID=68775 RepID=A0A5C3LLU9_9AGAR|nr:hypothetical protein BDQ12DRAFT_690789 [Crucibulum laeve]